MQHQLNVDASASFTGAEVLLAKSGSNTLKLVRGRTLEPIVEKRIVQICWACLAAEGS